jgi:hypothetical protein
MLERYDKTGRNYFSAPCLVAAVVSCQYLMSPARLSTEAVLTAGVDPSGKLLSSAVCEY